MRVASKSIWKWFPRPRPPAPWMTPMIELDSGAEERVETSLYQGLSQGKRSAAPPVAAPPPDPQPVAGGVAEPASVWGGAPPGSSGATAEVQAARRQARARRVEVGRMSCTEPPGCLLSSCLFRALRGCL